MTNSPTNAAPPVGLAVQPYSFGQSSNLTAEKSALYKEAAVQIAADLSKALGDSLPGFVVEAGSLIEAGEAEPIVENGDAFDTASVRSGHALRAEVITEVGLALTLVTAMLGSGPIPPGEARKLTSIERRVLDLLGQLFIDTAKSTLMVDEELSVDRSRDGAFAASDDDESAARIGFGFGLQGPGGGGRLILAFDINTIQEFSEAIDARLSGRRNVQAVATNPHTQAALRPVPIVFSVGLGSVSLSARQLVELEIGDVVRTGLPVDSELVASAGEVDLFGVRLGQEGKTLAAHITSANSPDGALAHARTVAS